MADLTQEQLVLHLTDMHALEMQSIKQLERATELAGDEQLERLYLEQERDAADKIADTFDRSVELMLEAANSQDEDAGDSEHTDDAQSESEAAHAARS
jgi:hypothetical protein